MYVTPKYKHGFSPFTDNIPELRSVPIMFSASQVYVPTSDDSEFNITRVLSIMDSFKVIDELLCFELFDRFIITPLKYQLIYGTGTPIASHINCVEFVSFSSKSINWRMISGATEKVFK